ncbi:MAG: Gfo/Idh/MocA family oxidoreductase [Planctomycetaceae bacterium]|nr:Gfo/Idh/MocA family oxidoreductase [Planctomycetaceae bacterium]
MSDTSVSRRRFMGTSAAVGAAAMVSARAGGAETTSSPNGKIHLGIIGTNGMGRGNLNNCAKHADVVVTAVCDVWDVRRKPVLAQFPQAKEYTDYRELLADKGVDAVIIATPPHWHALVAIDAARAGKHIYLQKPMTLHLGESLAVKNAVKRHNVICQVGTQIHAGENYRRVVEKIRAGHIGEVSVARTFNVTNQGPEGIGKVTDTMVPEGLDWNMWLGPGPQRPYNALLAANSYNHCSFMAYSGGWTPGMAPHIIDLPIWALATGYPTMVACSGGRYIIDDDGDAPDVQEMVFQYPNLTITWSMSMINSFAYDFGSGKPARRLGIYFFGSKGTLWSNYTNHEVVPEGDYFDPNVLPGADDTIAPSPGHEFEWIECIKAGTQPSCSPEYHCRVDIPLVLGNLSYRLGRSIKFDPKTLAIVGDDEAARLAVPEYREPWKFPKEYLG